MIGLGLKVREKITGLEGVVVGRCQYITGCDQYGIAAPAKDGRVEGTQWFDEGRLEVIGSGVLREDVSAPMNGGPNRDAPR